MRLLLDPVTREAAQQAARRELSRQPYHDAQPNPVLRLLGRALRWLVEQLGRADGTIGGGAVGRLLLLGVLVLVVVVAVVRLGPLGRRVPRERGLFAGGAELSAAQHRSLAEDLARQGRFAEAVRERLRAVVRELEARGVLDARPGRTAGEVCSDAGRAVPALAGDLHRAAGVFDEVWYGGRPAGPDGYALLVQVDDRVRAARLVPS